MITGATKAFRDDPDWITNPDNATAADFAHNVTFEAGAFEYDVVAMPVVLDEQGRPVLSRLSLGTQAIAVRSSLKGRTALGAILEQLAAAFEHHHGEPATAADRRRQMAAFATSVYRSLEPAIELHFLRADGNEKSGTPQTPDTAAPASNGSVEARAVAAA